MRISLSNDWRNYDSRFLNRTSARAEFLIAIHLSIREPHRRESCPCRRMTSIFVSGRDHRYHCLTMALCFPCLTSKRFGNRLSRQFYRRIRQLETVTAPKSRLKAEIGCTEAHSAVESAINALEVHGLDLCRDHGIVGFKRYVAWAVVARNIHRIGALLLRSTQTRRLMSVLMEFARSKSAKSKSFSITATKSLRPRARKDVYGAGTKRKPECFLKNRGFLSGTSYCFLNTETRTTSCENTHPA